MVKKRIVAFIASLALMIAVAGASAAVADTLLASLTPGGVAIACNSS